MIFQSNVTTYLRVIIQRMGKKKRKKKVWAAAYCTSSPLYDFSRQCYHLPTSDYSENGKKERKEKKKKVWAAAHCPSSPSMIMIHSTSFVSYSLFIFHIFQLLFYFDLSFQY